MVSSSSSSSVTPTESKTFTQSKIFFIEGIQKVTAALDLIKDDKKRKGPLPKEILYRSMDLVLEALPIFSDAFEQLFKESGHTIQYTSIRTRFIDQLKVVLAAHELMLIAPTRKDMNKISVIKRTPFSVEDQNNISGLITKKSFSQASTRLNQFFISHPHHHYYYFLRGDFYLFRETWKESHYYYQRGKWILNHINRFADDSPSEKIISDFNHTYDEIIRSTSAHLTRCPSLNLTGLSKSKALEAIDQHLEKTNFLANSKNVEKIIETIINLIHSEKEKYNKTKNIKMISELNTLQERVSHNIMRMAKLYYLLEDDFSALFILKKTFQLDLSPEIKPKIYAYIARSHFRMGEREEAKKILETALKEFPTHHKLNDLFKDKIDFLPTIPETKKIKKNKKKNKKSNCQSFLKTEPKKKLSLDEIQKRKTDAEIYKAASEKEAREKIESKSLVAEKTDAVKNQEEEKRIARNHRAKRHAKRVHQLKLKGVSRPAASVDDSTPTSTSSTHILSALQATVDVSETKEPVQTPTHSSSSDRIFALQPFEREIMLALRKIGKQACLAGSAVRERVRDKIKNIPSRFPIDQDRDFYVINATSSDIVNALKAISLPGYKITVKEHPHEHRLIYCFVSDAAKNFYRCEIWRSDYTSIEEHCKNGDFTVNVLSLDADEKLHDFLRGVDHLENNELHTCQEMDEAFKKDPWKIIRGWSLAHKHAMTIPPELKFTMEQDAPLLKTLPNFSPLYAWMRKSFAHQHVTRKEAEANLSFLIDHNIFYYLFSDTAALQINGHRDWVSHELVTGSRHNLTSFQAIFMVFYMCIYIEEMKLDSNENRNIQNEIYLKNPVFKTAFPVGFGPLFIESKKSFESFMVLKSTEAPSSSSSSSLSSR